MPIDYAITGSVNGLVLVRRHSTISSNADILWVGPLGTNFSEIRTQNAEISKHENSFDNVVYKIAASISRTQSVKYIYCMMLSNSVCDSPGVVIELTKDPCIIREIIRSFKSWGFFASPLTDLFVRLITAHNFFLYQVERLHILLSCDIFQQKNPDSFSKLYWVIGLYMNWFIYALKTINETVFTQCTKCSCYPL